MAASGIGRARARSGNEYEVKWDSNSRDVYVAYAGWTLVGKAESAGDAMRKAEAWLYNK